MIVPSIMPLPLRVVVMVSVLFPVFKLPAVIIMVDTLILFSNVTDEVADLLTVILLNVDTPEIEAFGAPVNWTILVPALKVPLLFQLPIIVWVKLPASNVVEVAIVNALLTVILAPAVLVLPLERIRLL